MKRSLAFWETAGFFFVVLVGSALHFAFAASGNNLAVALIAPVNESVWEHLKLFFFPFLLFALIEYRFIGRPIKNFWFTKGSLSLLGPLFIVAMFYTYSSLLGGNFLVADIGIFVISAGISAKIGYNIMTHKMVQKRSREVAIGIIVFMAIAFTIFTFRPPENELFADPLTGGYGAVRAGNSNE
ncbi:MAG: DUF6512 family protein [Candidatus Colwellbacteria bacterium]|jgi:phosphate/sulfate permease|nr:DUF6512 family protein [Candidatus Colwellbacteria bacterium]MDD4818953.1 DUF6512 family protein [Candidatus Colwellbacteria bacterium]